MKKLLMLLTALAIVMIGTAAESRSVTIENIASMPLAFTENQGQWDESVLFRANAGGATMWFTKNGAYYQFIRQVPTSEIPEEDYFPDRLDRLDHEPDSVEYLMINASFVGANPTPAISGEDMMEYKCNYFIGNDPNEWHTDVPNYNAIIYEEVYPGIDLKYYGDGRQMEYDFIVSPGADPSKIQVKYEGAKSLSVNSAGELVVETEWGTVTELKPLVYQVADNERTPIEGEYVLFSDNMFGFLLPEGYNCELALVIDPILSYSTYLGGDGLRDTPQSIAVDVSGNAYVTGMTESTDFPTTPGAYDITHNGGRDAFVTKLNSAGDGFVYSTYLGG